MNGKITLNVLAYGNIPFWIWDTIIENKPYSSERTGPLIVLTVRCVPLFWSDNVASVRLNSECLVCSSLENKTPKPIL
jgi:hypothetical protein